MLPPKGDVRVRTRLILAAFLLLVPVMPAWADFAAGRAAMHRGDYEAAYQEWLPLAQAGDARAQFHLGVLYERGWGIPQDFREAARLYLSAADQNHPEAQFHLGYLSEMGRGVPKQYAEVRKWYERAAANGNQRAEHRVKVLADLLGEEWGLTERVAEGVARFPTIAAPMYLSAYANILTRNARNAVKPLKHLVAADPAIADVRNALAIALFVIDPGDTSAAFKHAGIAIALEPAVHQFVVTHVLTDVSKTKVGKDKIARLTRVAAQELSEAAGRLRKMSGNAKRLGKLLKKIEETGADPEYPFEFKDFKKLVKRPNIVLTRPAETKFAAAQEAIEEKVVALREKLESKLESNLQHANEEQREAEARKRAIERQVAAAADRRKRIEKAKACALLRLQQAEEHLTTVEAQLEDEEDKRRQRIEAEDAVRRAHKELALIARAEEEARKEEKALKLARKTAAMQAAEAERKARSAEAAAKATMENLLKQITEQEKMIESLLKDEPPLIKVTSAPEAVELDDGIYQIAGLVGDMEGPPRTLIVNGKREPLFRLGADDEKIAEHTSAFRVNIMPKKEELQTIVFEVFDAAGNSTKFEMAVKITVANRPSIKGKNYALIIGSNDYEHLPKLKTAVNDATALAELLEERYSFEKGNITLLTNATRRDIMGRLSRLRKTLGSDDRLLLYYAGHGQIDHVKDECSWQPIDAEPDSDFTWITNADVRLYLLGMAAKHVLVIADSCFSGLLTGGAQPQIENEDKFFLNIDSFPSRRFISSGGTEPVADSGTGGHSIFSYYLLKALRNNDKPYITSFQLFDRFVKAVTINSNQTPQFGIVAESVDQCSGDFTFIRKKN